MSWSFAIRHGDLFDAGSGMGTVAGGAKLVQDLRCEILEQMGTDDMHPGFGCIIDGGVTPDGVNHPGIIGDPNDSMSASLVRAELERIAHGYQSRQIVRNQADLAVYGKSTLTADEALLSLANVNIEQVMDQMLVFATVQTGTNALPLSQIFAGS